MFIRDDMKACLRGHERLPFMSLKLMFQPPKGKLQVFRHGVARRLLRSGHSRHGRLQAGGGARHCGLFLKKGRHKFTV